MKAVILAAGKGTRLKDLTANQPKPMLVLDTKQTILEKLFSGIRDAGITEFIVVTGYFANLIEERFQDGRAWGIDIQYVRQSVLDGTGGALRLTRKVVRGEPMFMSFGDILINPHNYSRLIQDYQNDPVPAVLAVNETDDPHAGAAVHFDKPTRHVTQIIEKPPKGSSTSRWNNAGIFILEDGIYDYLDRLPLSPRGEYELTDALQQMIVDGLSLRALPLRGFWGDIGTPDDVERIRRLFQSDPQFLDH